MRQIGKTQRGVLEALDAHGGWESGCGWLWGTHKNTQKILDTLVTRGLAKAINSPGRFSVKAYRITAEGKEMLGASNGS